IIAPRSFPWANIGMKLPSRRHFTMAATEFVPVLLGSDINAYSMARAFHEAYGVHSVVYGMFPASVCAGSKIIDYRVREHNDRVDKVLENVTEVAKEHPD